MIIALCSFLKSPLLFSFFSLPSPPQGFEKEEEEISEWNQAGVMCNHVYHMLTRVAEKGKSVPAANKVLILPPPPLSFSLYGKAGF